MTYQISYFASTEEDRFRELLSSLKNEKDNGYKHASLCFWAPQNTLGGYAIFAHTDDEIAATCFLTRRDLNLLGTVHKCYEIGGTNTYPNHQRQGLFTKLVKTANEIAFQDPTIQLIFGTPNDRSGPGYKKFGYSFTDKENSRLIIFPKTIPFVKKIISKSASKTNVTRQSLSSNTELMGYKVESLDLQTYAKATDQLQRINSAAHGYIETRFNRINTPDEDLQRTYFKISKSDSIIYVSLKKHSLQNLELILVSECFYNDNQINFSHLHSVIKKICEKSYKDFDGVYVKAIIDTQQSNIANFVFKRYLVHRTLPICYLENPNRKSVMTSDFLEEMTSNFQMTDCDIG